MARSDLTPYDGSGERPGARTTRDRPSLDELPPFTLEPPPLGADTIEEFLVWAAQVPHTDADLIREQIAGASPDVVGGLTGELGRLPIDDAGRFLLVLATVGELQHDDFVEPLRELIWTEDDVVVRTGDDSVPPRPDADATSFFEPGMVIKARAAEMLSYIGGGRADEAIADIIRDHPLPAVRVAAIDAHLFNHGDDPAMLAGLRDSVRSEDQPHVGLARWGREMDPRAFDEAMLDYHERHSGARPELPESREGSGDPAPRPRRFDAQY
jgi:hypothetical protein